MDQSSDQHILDLGTLDNNRSEQQENKNCTYILGTRTRKCRIAKRTHKSNHIWLVTFRQRRYSNIVMTKTVGTDFQVECPRDFFGNDMGSVTNQ